MRDKDNNIVHKQVGVDHKIIGRVNVSTWHKADIDKDIIASQKESNNMQHQKISLAQ